jgi:exodeoxyribonuclease VII small subunit
MIAPKDDAPSSAPVSFEQSMDRLSQIVKKLEGGELPLEQSLQLFEEGVKLSRLAQGRLDAAQQRIERLLTVDSQGRPRTAPFETTRSEGAPDDPDEEPPF